MKEINNFSKEFWNDIINFQWTGWNISFKEDWYLYIKSSWYRISDIYTKWSLSKINISWFFDDLENEDDKTEDIITKLIEDNNLSKLKASIETGFHLSIDSKYIIHTHNIYINVLLCMDWWERILNTLFWDTIDIIDYKSPWLGLFNNLSAKKNLNSIILLKNHWIISHWNTSFIDLYKKINNIESIIRKKIKLDIFKVENNTWNIDNHIFPDTIVINDKDVNSAHKYIKKQIKKIWWTIKYLSDDEVDYIKNMKTEKYRKRIFNKK